MTELWNKAKIYWEKLVLNVYAKKNEKTNNLDLFLKNRKEQQTHFPLKIVENRQ